MSVLRTKQGPSQGSLPFRPQRQHLTWICNHSPANDLGKTAIPRGLYHKRTLTWQQRSLSRTPSELQNHWANNSSFKHSGEHWSSGKVNKPIKYGCIIIDSVHFSMTGRYSNSSILQHRKEELIWLFRFRPLEYLQQFRFLLHAIHFEGFSSDLEKNTGDFLLLKTNIYYYYTCAWWMCVCTRASACATVLTVEVREQLCGVGSFLSTWVSGIELRPPGLHGKGLHQPNHFTGLIYSAQFWKSGDSG